jgi:L-malate glycosyltransferase
MSGAVHQVLATLGYGDAIGHEVLGIQRVLRGAGFESEIFVETAHRRLESLTTDYREMVGLIAPGDILVHHFSIGSRASRTAYALPGRMALVYHNITPPEYFLGVHKDLVKLCFRGRRELTAYVSRCDIALGDSEYNRQELERLQFAATDVLPVVPDFSHLDGPPSELEAADFDDGWTNILFVGRVIPNKKFEDVIRAFHVYRSRHNPRSRLLLVGAYSGFEAYYAMLQSLIARLGVRDVHFLGHVTNEELTAIYDVADLFLCASEHEGFCVPLVESFYKRVPVLAFAATAVPATMDGGGVLYTTKDPFEVARLMSAILDDPDVETAVLASQDAALTRLLQRDFAGTLLRFVDRLRALGPRQAPEVPWDFWPQFNQAERLEELRQFRPALYRALPQGPEPCTRDAESGNSKSMRDQHGKATSPGSSGNRVPHPGSRP